MAGVELIALKLGEEEEMHLPDLGHIDHREQRLDLELGASLFVCFSCRALG